MSKPLFGKMHELISILNRALPLPRVLLPLSVLLLLQPTTYAVTEVWVNSTRSSIRALDSARTTSVYELEQASLSEQEASEYRDFVVYLNTRILTYCKALYQSGETGALADLPCPSADTLAAAQGDPPSENSTGTYTSAKLGTSRTRAEKTEDLHDGFLEALGEFDQMLLKEEEKVAARVPRQRETGQSGSGTGSGTGSGAEGRGGERGGETAWSSEQNMGGVEGSAADGGDGEQAGAMGAGGTPGAPGRGGAPDETQARAGASGGTLPPSEDDDIVARQLREAAEKEPDPELKKKLWEEYWKYKGVTRKSE